MGKFDGYLICSDVDGTFRAKPDEKPNIDAVKYFTDNGGRFTFATGRTVSHLRQTAYNDIINAPACLYNGGVVYDYEKDVTLYKKYVDFTLGDFIKATDEFKSKIKRLSVYDNSVGESDEKASSHEAFSPEELDAKPIKIICVFNSCEEADEFQNFAGNQSLFKNSYICKSWPVGVEFNAADGTKGHALDFIKDHLGNIHTAIGIGDFDNDVPLLEHADIGVAVGNAVESVKNVSDMCVMPCNEFAIKDLIEIIEKSLK